MIYRYSADPGGWRFVVQYHKGRKWTGFLDTATLQATKRRLSDPLDLFPCSRKPAALAGRLEKRRALLKRCGVSFSRTATEKANRKLRDTSS